MADTGKTIGLIKALASVDPEAIKSSVDDWLDDHPEATTTVEDGAITKAKLDSSLQQTVDEVGDLKSAVGDVVYTIPTLQLGNITIASDGTATYQVRDYGVITPSGSFCVFQKGTVLSLSDYSGAKFAVPRRNGTKLIDTGWITSGTYTIPQSGEYALNIQSVPTTAQSSVDALAALLVVDASTLAERMESAENEIADLQPPTRFSLNGIKAIAEINNFWPQGVAAVGNKVLMFYASNDAHTNHANVNIYNISDLTTRIGYIEHNTGHCASADYSEITDELLIANGNNPAPTPIVYLVTGFADKLEQLSNIEYDGTDVVALDLSDLTDEAVVGCFGETGDIIYVVTGSDNYDVDITKTIYQLQIGRGTNNMVSSYPSASAGTYSAASDGVPNGTVRVMATYTVDFPGELQGLKYINGKLIVPCDSRVPNGTKTPYLVSVGMAKSGAEVLNTYWIPALNAAGTRPAVETEDVLFYGADGYCEANNIIYKFSALML